MYLFCIDYIRNSINEIHKFLERRKFKYVNNIRIIILNEDIFMKKKILNFLLLSLLCCSISIPTFAVESDAQEIKLKTKEDIENNAIELNWNKLENAQTYQIYQKKPNSIDEFQSISAADLNDENLHINVLNIYPSVGNNLKTWMENNGYGKGIMSIDELTMDDFNKNPNLLKNDDGTWKYDVIVIGFWDCNNYKDIQDNAKQVLEQFIQSGRGVVFGHDTICSSINSGFRSLQTYVNLNVPNDEKWDEYLYGGSETVTLQKTGLFNTYPWNIGGLDTVLTIPYSHNVGQFANSDIWLKFGNENGTYNGWNFYLTTYNNCAMIMTGHSGGQATDDEQKILANTIFYTYQITTKNKHLDYSGQDVNCPNLPYITIDSENKLIKLNSEDTGTKYTYYVKANMKDNTNIESNQVSQIIKTGIKGYYYILDNNAFTNIDETNAKYTESVINTNEIDGNSYLHVYSIDNAGNKSSIAHINVDTLPEITTQPKDVVLHTGENKKIEFKVEAKGDYLTYQWQHKINDEWIDMENKTKNTLTIEDGNVEDNNVYRCLISNDTSFVYSNEVFIKKMDSYITIPKDINIDGNKKVGKYEIEKSEDLKDTNISVTPTNKVKMKLNGATTYANFESDNLTGFAKITTGISGTWKGFTTFEINYN